MTSTTLGILGTGHLASYTVAGLRNSSDTRKILLSPRNSQIAQKLSKKYRCQVADSNQQVVEQSTIILLAVRPHQLDGLLKDLHFEPSTLIISAIAGVSIDQLKSYSNLKNLKVVRTLLNVSAEVNVGPVPVYPDIPQASQLLGNLGTLIAFDQEKAFDIAVVHGCMHGWVYFWLDEMVNWTTAQGLDSAQAEKMIKQTVQGAIDLSNHKNASLNEIGSSIATEGTYTAAGLEKLNTGSAIKAWSGSMQSVMEELSNNT